MTIHKGRGWQWNDQDQGQALYTRPSRKIRRRLPLPDFLEAFFPSVGPIVKDYVEITCRYDRPDNATLHHLTLTALHSPFEH